MTSTKSKEIADEYISSLSDLTINSKPLINMLTMLAEDNVEHASAIVQAVESHLQKVRSEIKLPVLYLIDSIVKNVNGAYLSLFTQNIVNTFCGVFEKVDENTRSSMYKLRQTWNEVFPAKKLYSLDVRVQSIDPAWPITTPAPKMSSGSIHVNPRFLVSTPAAPATPIVPAPIKLPPGEPASMSEAVMREQLLKKQRELLELQKQKIELELLQAKTSLEQQQRQLDKQSVAIKPDVIVPTALVMPTTEVPQKPVAPVAPSQATKQLSKKFRAATASLLKVPGSLNGPRIAPASSIAVASARPVVSRDPRLKPSSGPLETGSGSLEDSRPARKGSRSREKDSPESGGQSASLSEQLSAQLGSKNSKKIVSGDFPAKSSISNNTLENNSNNNNNNKTLSGLTNKEVVTHRASQKKEPRASSTTNNNINNSNNSINNIEKSINNIEKSINNRENRENVGIMEEKVSEVVLENSSTAPGSGNGEKISKQSSRKLGNKSRPKQPEIPAKYAKIESATSTSAPGSSPRKTREDEPGLRGKSPPGIPRAPESIFSKSSSSSSSSSSGTTGKKSPGKKNSSKNRKRSPSPTANYRIPRRIDSAKISGSTGTTSTATSVVSGNNSCIFSSDNSAELGVTEEEQSGSLIVSPAHPPPTTFKDIRANARARNYVRRNKKSSSSSQADEEDENSTVSSGGGPAPGEEVADAEDQVADDAHFHSHFSGSSGPSTRHNRHHHRRHRSDTPGETANRDNSPGMTSNTRSPDGESGKSARGDEDLRGKSAAGNGGAGEKIEDLDLRVLPPVSAPLAGSDRGTNKRQSTERDCSVVKKSKAEKFDALFGNEDVDLRTLTHPKAGRPPTPPPPVISGGEDGKDGWAKLKTPNSSTTSSTTSTSREKSENKNSPIASMDEKRERDRTKDRLGRPRLYSKLPDDPKERRRTLSSDDPDSQNRANRRGISGIPGLPSRSAIFGSLESEKSDRNSERNIEIIMKQAAEQLKQGCISSSDYQKLMQEVLHMSEEQKLRAAQRKEVESIGIWDQQALGMLESAKNRLGHMDPVHSKFSPVSGSDLGPEGMLGRAPKDRLRAQRWAQNHQPWQQPPGPWAHPPGGGFSGSGIVQGPFGNDFRPLGGPWQNPRAFSGPMRNPDFSLPGFHRHAFGPGIGQQNRIPPGIVGIPGHNGPIMNILPNGAAIAMANLPISGQISGNSGILMNNGNLQSGQLSGLIGANLPPIRPNSPRNSSGLEAPGNEPDSTGNSEQNGPRPPGNARELPLPDPKQLDAIANDRMKSIEIDGEPREIRYYGQTGIVFMRVDDPREIGFQDGARRVLIGDKDTVLCSFNEPYKDFVFEGEVHRIRLGGPSRELYIDDRWYECYFGGLPIKVELGKKKVSVKLEGPPPQVKIGSVKRSDLVVGKVHMIIDARELVPVFVDAKPQIFEIDGHPQILEFIDCLERVLLNGRPFNIVFGGLPTSIHVRGQKHFFRFTVLPQSVRPGYVNIVGMRGEPPKELPQEATPAPQETPANPPPANPAQTLEGDSSKQENPPISAVLTSEPAPSGITSAAITSTSGGSYKAETTENSGASLPAPAATLTLPLNMTELFQRLVETGIVPNLTETKKPEEEQKKKPALLPVSFDKPETLKVKQPAIASALYSGIQCSSCGARFAPELATRYSHHLDWHFRQNRRERDSARKAHSRPWYYDVSDWIQFEEIEDLEDRAQSWFETEKQTAETEGAASEDAPQETVLPSVPTGNDEDSRCQVCHDNFEQFYNEEKEEWHLRPTVSHEGKNYHPMCLDDHKHSLEKSALALLEEEKKSKNEEEIAEEAKGGEEKSEEKSADGESAEKEEKEGEKHDETTPEKSSGDENPTMETEISAIEEISGMEIDTEKSDEKSLVSDEKSKSDPENPDNLGDNDIVALEDSVKVKKEPIEQAEIDEDGDVETDFNFADVKIKEEPVDPEPENEESMLAEAAVVDTTHTAVKSTIDGNVELESGPTAIPAAPSRIKINITKPLSTAATKDPEDPKEASAPAPEASAPAETAIPQVPASLKPALQGRKLSNLPPVEKGQELSGLCSIM